MPPVNGYTLLQYVKDGKKIVSTNVTEDAWIDRAIEAASREFDKLTGRRFYPSYMTRLYDVPNGRRLWLNEDLLAIDTLTNGDGTVLTTTDYLAPDPNVTPYWCIDLKDVSDAIWEVDSDGSSQRVISVAGPWGYRTDYPRAWVATDTLGAAVANTTVLTWTTTGSALFLPGQIVRVDNEICVVSTCVTTALTVLKRGENGSTPATHLINAPLYVWAPEPPVRAAVEDIVLTMYHKRFGMGMEAGAAATVTAAGVVITPKDITDFAKSVAMRYVQAV
jgi:hypothetical protein